jgi:hypothetical protein
MVALLSKMMVPFEAVAGQQWSSRLQVKARAVPNRGVSSAGCRRALERMKAEG